MKAKITRVEEGLAVVLHPSLVEQLGFEENTDVDLVVRHGTLVVIPESKRDRQFRDALEKIDEQYGEVFRRLADS